jgi:HSP20 family protein
MTIKKEPALMRKEGPRDPLTLLRRMTAEFDRMFEEPGWPFRWPFFATRPFEAATWLPGIDVFERDNLLVTRIDLPGVKKEHFYRLEREYGTFYRAVPLPAGVKFEEVKATFADGVLEVTVPLPAKPEPAARRVEIQGEEKPAKAA